MRRECSKADSRCSSTTLSLRCEVEVLNFKYLSLNTPYTGALKCPVETGTAAICVTCLKEQQLCNNMQLLSFRGLKLGAKPPK